VIAKAAEDCCPACGDQLYDVFDCVMDVAGEDIGIDFYCELRSSASMVTIIFLDVALLGMAAIVGML
jgi:hypothetical protein